MADEREHVAEACLSPELLGAYVDGRIDARLREEIQAHLAECEACYELVIELVRAQEAESLAGADPSVAGAIPRGAADPTIPDTPKRLFGGDTAGEARTGTVVPFNPRRTFIFVATGSLLAAAAAVMLVVRIQSPWWQQLRGTNASSRMAGLAEAVGQERLIEGRLSGGFRYAPLRSPTRSSSSERIESLSLLAAAAQLQRDVADDPSPGNRHAWGVAQVLLGEYDPGILELEQASAAIPTDARIHSDLAAAYLARARALGRSDDASRALAEANRALQLDPTIIEALFNRGLALEQLGQREQAMAVWRDLSERDQSEWRVEAERRLTAQAQPIS